MTTIQYRLLEALKVALPMLPVQIRDGVPWIDYWDVRAEYTDVLAVTAMLTPHDLTRRDLPTDLREIARRIAPWWRTMDRTALQSLDGGPVAMVPLDPDTLFRDACARVVDWLGTDSGSGEIAACLGSRAAIECARLVSPLARHLLFIPAVWMAVSALDEGRLPSRNEADRARAALSDTLSREWHACSPDAPLVVALVDLLYASQANEYAWALVTECARAQRLNAQAAERAMQHATIRAVLRDYEPELTGQTADRYTEALSALSAFIDGGPAPAQWVSEATAPASKLIDEAYRSLRVRAIYYLLIATLPNRAVAMVASAIEILEQLREEPTRRA